jgi:hypothetical protein
MRRGATIDASILAGLRFVLYFFIPPDLPSQTTLSTLLI